MRSMRSVSVGGFVSTVVVVLCLSAVPARATFHLWKFDQAFSNADGSQQFIELFCPAPGQQFTHTDAGGPFGPAELTSGSSTFIFPTDLPLPAIVGHDTDNQHMLIATAGFKPGGLTPDFALPAHFFSTSADSLNYLTGTGIALDTFSWSSLPTDGSALFQVQGTADQSIGAAEPHNFGGGGAQSIPLPASAGPGMAMLALIAARGYWSRHRRLINSR